MVFSGAYSLWLFNRIVYGNLKVQYLSNFKDLDKKEIYIFFPLVFFTILFGIFPDIILNALCFSIIDLTSFISDNMYTF
jgi:NADH-quinone oxidoreductase subunit M